MVEMALEYLFNKTGKNICRVLHIERAHSTPHTFGWQHFKEYSRVIPFGHFHEVLSYL